MALYFCQAVNQRPQTGEFSRKNIESNCCKAETNLWSWAIICNINQNSSQGF